jgi:uncharacterized protein with HEPN domain
MIDKADRDRLRDMLRYAEEAIEFVGELDAGSLAADRRTLLAVLYCLLVVGEAAGRVLAGTRARLPAVRWTQVTGMRHHLAHGYGDIRTEIVVGTVRQDLPVLTSMLRNALEDDVS